MTGITRYMRILALFNEQHPSWTVAEISEALSTSASTLYRLVRELVAAGLLESTVESRYRLGPLFIEFFRRIRLTDPLTRSGMTFLEPMLLQIPVPCSAVLARLYGASVMCVAERRSPTASFESSYELGRPMPLLQGATSKAVLSTLGKRKIETLLKEAAPAPEVIGKLMAELRTVRKNGVIVTAGEVDSGLVGIAAPVQNKALGINASLSVISEASALSKDVKQRVMTIVSTTARMIEVFMAERAPSADHDIAGI